MINLLGVYVLFLLLWVFVCLALFLIWEDSAYTTEKVAKIYRYVLNIVIHASKISSVAGGRYSGKGASLCCYV